jgi:hypothetical protein
LPFFEALIDEFFRRNWLMFHCLLIGKSEVDLSFHENSWDLACRKHFTNLLANKIKRFAAPGKHYRIRVDPIHSSYAKADEVAEIILRNIMANAPSLKGQDVIESVVTVDSKQSPGVQLSRSTCRSCYGSQIWGSNINREISYSEKDCRASRVARPQRRYNAKLEEVQYLEVLGSNVRKGKARNHSSEDCNAVKKASYGKWREARREHIAWGEATRNPRIETRNKRAREVGGSGQAYTSIRCSSARSARSICLLTVSWGSLRFTPGFMLEPASRAQSPTN